ncbi:MAG TPA: hypothetical protein PLO12_10210 [Solirubrobacterales bacterium]|nr:hypothetical protein [Solirubrobacterales bacterium]HMY27138.1 hypothetical protein [Solirubrobacterales bacterium]HNA44980.1 hypothetical protein [Solirubrobacterales bacterium]
MSTDNAVDALSDREHLVELARGKPTPPYTLDEELTFFCPQENLEGLDLPVVREFHRWVTTEHQPAPGDEKAVLLLLPCEKAKPYSLSAEHRAVSNALGEAGYEPRERGDWPEELAGLASPQELSNAPLVGPGGLRIDRAVISEPFGIVPYEAIYRWRGEPTPCARYDDPGLFEHRGIGCLWREDATVSRTAKGYSWGDNERAAYVEVHDRLSALIDQVLTRLSARYEAILAYVGHTLTHRTFLASDEERREAGIPQNRRVGGETRQLIGVNDRSPGLVRLVPDAEGLEQIRAESGGRLPSGFLTGAPSLGQLELALRQF